MNTYIEHETFVFLHIITDTACVNSDGMEINMEQYYLIGSPVKHSLSPLIHNTSFESAGYSARYGLIETDEEHLEETVARLKTEKASGWNVTMPVKTAMCDFCDELSLASEIGRSVNTVKNVNGRLYGYTTDGIGLFNALAKHGLIISSKKIVLLGTGGAASAILIEAALRSAGKISVFYNQPGSAVRAEQTAEKLKPYSESVIRLFSYAEEGRLGKELSDADLLINATNVGMQGGPLSGKCLVPNESYLPSSLFVCDIIYHPFETALLKMARNCGCRSEGGLAMLVGQAAESYRIWTGLTMPEDLILDTLTAHI